MFNETSIVIDVAQNISFGSGFNFNGMVITDSNPNLVSAAIASNTLAGFDASRFASTASSISLDFDSLSFTPGQSLVSILGRPDADGDGIPDDEDNCPETPAGSVVNAEGCAIVQLCPCEHAWKNHGAYVRCVAPAAEDFVAADLITEAEKDAIASEAAQSSCGDK
jgi:hypothetical protein